MRMVEPVPGARDKLLPGRDLFLVQFSCRQEFARYTIPATGEQLPGRNCQGTNAAFSLLNPDPGLFPGNLSPGGFRAGAFNYISKG